MNRNTLLNLLETKFDENDLKKLCFALKIDYESLPVEGKAAKALALIEYCERMDRYAELVAAAEAARPGPQPLPDAAALKLYLDHIIEGNRRLKLQGIRSAGELVSIDLEQIYITLTATVKRGIETEEAWVKEMAQFAPGETMRMNAQRPRESVQQVKVNVQEALREHQRLVVLGDPGSGKTTLLSYLALTYARDLFVERGLVEQRLQLKAEQRLPILLPLRNFAGYLSTQKDDPSIEGARILLGYLRAYFAGQDIDLPERFFAERLHNGQCVVLLDGVDEVADFSLRQRVARAVERFVVRYPNNRYVITSRIAGYTGAARIGEGFVTTTVRDFSNADVERFVTHWNRAIEVALTGKDSPIAAQAAQRSTDALLNALRANERVRELAVNPLLLTVIALVQRYRAQLPDRRTELYEEAIEVLLSAWDVAKGLAESTSVVGLELDAGDRRSLLEPIALWMMEQHVREIDAGELRRQLTQRFAELSGEAKRAAKMTEGFLKLIEERSGLLAERAQGVYSFSHLTFQEHLAARAIAARDDYIEYSTATLGDSWWRETMLLQAGYLSTQGQQRVTAFIRAIMDAPGRVGVYDNLVLAAECLRDVGRVRVRGDLWGEVQQRLRKVFEQPLVKKGKGSKKSLQQQVAERATAAEALGRIESGGFGIHPAFWRLPYGEPVWVNIPAGEFWMGSEGIDNAKPIHRVYLDVYQIAQVPVTNAQYQLFVEAAKHPAPQDWQDGKPPRGKENHPAVNVSWEDATTYCAWLSQMSGKKISLPTEAQWERAARGDEDQRNYPWGEWFDGYCNTAELGIGDTTPVGIFPEGISPHSCLDMAGNVWEWCADWYDGDAYAKRVKMGNLVSNPTRPSKGSSRVVRCGSFYSPNGYARCAFRLDVPPKLKWNYYGFRIVVSPIS